ncbi:MAG: hypothetical protein IPL61_08540 [Myxococcales bacterium]|nr:hypothetical protein [Myxococcales bacterium]
MIRLAIGCALAGGLAGALVACAGRAQPPVAWSELQAKRNEITALATQIRQWRHEGGLGVEPDDATVLAMAYTTAATAARACVLPAPPVTRCADVCELGSAICENAEDICAIAAELGDDAWAKDKCDSAKASCREAQERCCTCNREETP